MKMPREAGLTVVMTEKGIVQEVVMVSRKAALIAEANQRKEVVLTAKMIQERVGHEVSASLKKRDLKQRNQKSDHRVKTVTGTKVVRLAGINLDQDVMNKLTIEADLGVTVTGIEVKATVLLQEKVQNEHQAREVTAVQQVHVKRRAQNNALHAEALQVVKKMIATVQGAVARLLEKMNAAALIVLVVARVVVLVHVMIRAAVRVLVETRAVVGAHVVKRAPVEALVIKVEAHVVIGVIVEVHVVKRIVV